MLCAHPLYRLPATARFAFTPTQLRDFPREKNGAYFFNETRYKALFSPSQRLFASEIGCGQCLACRLNRAKKWAVRCLNEAETTEGSTAFITLTYDDEHLPRRLIVHPVSGELLASDELAPDDLQLFLKRLRNRLGPGVRFFACGEYGGITDRPHYHALLFGLPDTWDASLSFRTPGHFHSAILDEAWPLGLHDVAALEWNSAAYVARYCLKKASGTERVEMDYLSDHYPGFVPRAPEFVRMSRRPGIGAVYYAAHKDQIAALDGVIYRGPRGVELLRGIEYYDRLYDLDHKEPTEERTKYGRDLRRLKSARQFVGQMTSEAVERLTDATKDQRRAAEDARLKKKMATAKTAI